MESRNAADNLTESMEDYLEAIYLLAQDRKVVRVKDLMNFLDYKVSSVNSAVKNLADRGFDLLICHASGYQTVCPEFAA